MNLPCTHILRVVLTAALLALGCSEPPPEGADTRAAADASRDSDDDDPTEDDDTGRADEGSRPAPGGARDAAAPPPRDARVAVAPAVDAGRPAAPDAATVPPASPRDGAVASDPLAESPAALPDLFRDGGLFAPKSPGPPSPDNVPECPPVAPDNPIGSCIGVPIYATCTYGTYVCLCDWYHWLCI